MNQGKMNLKICGLTAPEDIILLDMLKVQFGGLWCGVPNGPHDLSIKRFRDLATIETRSMKKILVTFVGSLKEIQKIVQHTDIYGIQLHGFQLPSLVQQIKSHFGDALKIFKVLHLNRNECIEAELIERYLESGVDYFILDYFQSKEKIGSTGIPVNQKILKELIPKRIDPDKVIIAGGVNETNILQIYNRFKAYGVDIDSSARKNSQLCRACVSNLLNSLSVEVTSPE